MVAVLVVLGRALGSPAGRPLPAPLPPTTLELRALDVGQGDALLLRLDDRTLLVDAGPDAQTVRETILPRLRAMQVVRLDYLVLTHPDADHIGGAPELMRTLPVGQVVVWDAPSDHPVFQEVLRLAGELPVPVRSVRQGDRLSWHPAVETQVLNPAAGDCSDNDLSVVLRVVYGNAVFLLTGDLEQSVESELIRQALPLAADVLKVGHHGSDTSSSPAFLDRVAPQVAIVLAGRDNSFGHPREAVLDRLLDRGVAVFRTDLSGDVAVCTDGDVITVQLERA